jgi:AraC-like DNA-binding protein
VDNEQGTYEATGVVNKQSQSGQERALMGRIVRKNVPIRSTREEANDVRASSTQRKSKTLARGSAYQGAGAEASSVDTLRLRLALARLPGSMRKALRLFRQLTGFSAATSVTSTIDDRGEPREIAPPVHPRCGRLARTIRHLPCKGQWRMHVRRSRAARRAHSHTCPVGLLCSCVPIFFGEALVGVAKLVVDSGTPRKEFSAATRVLELTVSWFTQDLYLLMMTGEMQVLRERVGLAEDALSDSLRTTGTFVVTTAPCLDKAAAVGSGSLIHKALGYLEQHYLDPTVSLTAVARAVGGNGKYLSHLFTEVVGERMHAYIMMLRIQHACQLLLRTDMLIKQVGLASGFSTGEQFLRNFRSHMGLSPGGYRRMLTNV